MPAITTVCEWCKFNLDAWHGEHAENCPHEIFEFIKGHVCQGTAADYQICFPCEEYLEEKLKIPNFYYSLADRWSNPKFHTEFCRSFRAFMESKIKTVEVEVLPKIQHRPESET